MKVCCISLMALVLSGCASSTHQAKQRVMVMTPGAPKATCILISKSMSTHTFTTPEAIDLPKSSDAVEINCHKTCFHDESKTFNPAINSEDLATNSFFGGAGPLAIDLATKKYYNYPYELIIPMKPDKSCRRNIKGFLDGNSKDFDNQIKDFSFDDYPKPIPEIEAEDVKDSMAPISTKPK